MLKEYGRIYDLSKLSIATSEALFFK